jgi:ABC-type glycerol-3-phosphate transport system substrate-binding protein
MKRIITLAIAFATVLAVLLGGASAPASAATTRPVTLDAFNIGDTVYVKGHVGPNNTYRFRKVIIQKRKCADGSCKWVYYKDGKTNGMSNYRLKVFVPQRGKVTYRTKVPASGAYAVSYSGAHVLSWQ